MTENKTKAIKTKWEDIAEIVRQHFIKLLGTPLAMLEEALGKVLKAKTIKILAKAKDELEKPITSEEVLHSVATSLAKNKVPREDGILTKFFMLLWDHICRSNSVGSAKIGPREW